MKWTKDELDEEWNHVYQTRLGILCGDGTPTPDQDKIARDEANEHIAMLRRTENE